MNHHHDDGDGLVKPQVLILPEAKAQMDAYIRLCDMEVSGLGYVKQEGSVFLVESVLLLPQECSGASTELDAEGLAQFYTDQIRQNKDTGNIRLWWHSHCNSGVFWSGVDTANIDRLMDTSPWLVSIVGNKRGEYRTRLDLNEPVRLSVDELPLNVYIPTSKKRDDETRVELDKKVRPTRYAYGGSYLNWRKNWADW